MYLTFVLELVEEAFREDQLGLLQTELWEYSKESALRLYIIGMDQLSMPVTRDQIRATAQAILNRLAAMFEEVHEREDHWAHRFLNRQADLKHTKEPTTGLRSQECSQCNRHF